MADVRLAPRTVRQQAVPDARLDGVRAVSYDLWLTLLRDKDPELLWSLRVQRLATLLDRSGDDVRTALRGAHEAHRSAWDHGKALAFDGVAGAVVRAAGVESDPELVQAVSAALDDPVFEAGVDLLPGVADTLRTLSLWGVPLGLVCDSGFTSGRALRRVLDEAGIGSLFTALVFSDEVGEPKPSARPFHVLLQALDLPGDAVVHVGDLRRKDTAGARAGGLGATVRFRGERDDEAQDGDLPDADIVIDRHEELLPLLGLQPT